jgi:hypothetical protein
LNQVNFMDALPAALRSSLGAILMNCQRLGKLPQGKLCALDKRREQVGMIVRIEAGAGEHADQPRELPHAAAHLAEGPAPLPGRGAVAAVLQRIAIGLRRAGAFGVAAVGSL